MIYYIHREHRTGIALTVDPGIAHHVFWFIKLMGYEHTNRTEYDLFMKEAAVYHGERIWGAGGAVSSDSWMDDGICPECLVEVTNDGHCLSCGATWSLGREGEDES